MIENFFIKNLKKNKPIFGFLVNRRSQKIFKMPSNL